MPVAGTRVAGVSGRWGRLGFRAGDQEAWELVEHGGEGQGKG